MPGLNNNNDNILWIYVEPNKYSVDNHPTFKCNIDRNDETPEMKPLRKILRNMDVNGVEGDMLEFFKHLWPGTIQGHCQRMGKHSQFTPIIEEEFLVFLGIMIGSTQRKEVGRDLWEPSTSIFRTAPDFGKWMSRHRFEDIKVAFPTGFVSYTENGNDQWYKFREAVDMFNENRLNIDHSGILVIDESM